MCSLHHVRLSPGDHGATLQDCQLLSQGSGSEDFLSPPCPSAPGRSSGPPKGEEPASCPWKVRWATDSQTAHWSSPGTWSLRGETRQRRKEHIKGRCSPNQKPIKLQIILEKGHYKGTILAWLVGRIDKQGRTKDFATFALLSVAHTAAELMQTVLKVILLP